MSADKCLRSISSSRYRGPVTRLNRIREITTVPADSLTAQLTPHSLLDAPRLSITQAARKLGVSLATLHRWRQRGIRGQRLRFVRIGNKSFVLRDELERFLAGCSDPPADDGRDDDYEQRVAEAELRAAAMGL
jgi:excisionase family DNA binding protein